MSVEENSTASFQIEKIYSEFEIGNILFISLRHAAGSELAFVTFEDDEAASYTTVHLDATGVEPGNYMAYLESIDLNGSAQSTLMTN